MFENLSNDDISTAIDELIACLGVREERPSTDLLTLIRKKDAQACVQAIATRLGLPVRISLSYVPKGFRPGATDGFRSSALSRTDWDSHGIESTTAQVAIPRDLPMFGTSGLQGYPIRVRVSESCHEHAETFVAVMTHELSHVLLRALRHPLRESELHTDLVPILLGFRDVVGKGRKTVQTTMRGNETTTHTTTYGYLTDTQFAFACSRVTSILQGHQRDKKHVLTLVARVRRKLHTATRFLSLFLECRGRLDAHPPREMRPDDALRAVQFHARDYTRDWEIGISQATTSLEKAEAFVPPLSHYTSTVVEQLRQHRGNLELASRELDQMAEGITRDIGISRRYMRVLDRLRSWPWLRWLPGA